MKPTPLRAARYGALLLAAAPAAAAQRQPASPVLAAMREELARSLQALRAQPTSPYFISYSITEVHAVTVTAAFGAIVESDEDRRRELDVEVRVGDYAFDNTRVVPGEFPGFDFFFDMGDRTVEIPLEDDPAAIRAALWYQTDRRYKRAVEQLTRVRTNVEVRVAAEDQSPDFSREPPETHVEPPARLAVDRRAWEAKVRRYSAPFARHGDLYGASATLGATVETRWYVNSEGTELQTSQPIYRLLISAFTKADDGMELPRHETFFSFTPEGLPADRDVLLAVERMIADLQALRRAPAVEPYTGPAILSGRASAVFFHEVFGHRIEGHRQKREYEGQTFKKRVNDRVLPAGFSVSFDPTLRRLGDTDLAGSYRFDDEGVRARRVPVVEEGVLKTFLMSRSPIEGFASSNGHGRRQVGLAPVARQSNLLVEVARPVSRADLKRMLVERIMREQKPFGLFFDDIEGGFTITGRGFPNAFNVLPVMVYRVFPDGREELVRGADLIGTPLTTFSQIAAADDRVEVFNGLCGAESGLIPVSAVSPGVLIAQIEIQKKSKSQDRPPLLPPPPEGRAAQGDVVIRALRDELARSMQQLRLDTMPAPYFVAYRIDEIEQANAAANLGSLTRGAEQRARHLTVEVRVGDYAFDNTNFLGLPRGFGGFLARFEGQSQVPLDDDYREIRRQLWLATDGAYKEAVENLSGKRAALQNRTRSEQVPDFSREDTATISDVLPTPTPTRRDGEALVRELSALFRTAPEVYRSAAEWSGQVVRTWYVNSEGTSFVRAARHDEVRVQAGTQAVDGTPLEDFVVAYGSAPPDLGARAALVARVREMTDLLARRRRAPAAETYNGPVLFEAEASAELFRQAFAPQLVANRAPISGDPMFAGFAALAGSGFVDHIGGRVLPPFMSVTDDPTLREYDGRPLGGGYRVDDDGVPARATKVVDRGVLRTLLTTRVPVRGLLRSTGNRRGMEPSVSNLLVAADNGLSDEGLRRRLLELAAARGRPYGVVVGRLASPSLASIQNPMAFLAAMDRGEGESPALVTAEAFKLYPDGRQEPLPVGSIEGITARMFREIVAASRTRTVYTASSAIGGPRLPAFFQFAGAGPGHASSYVVPSVLFEDVSLKRPGGDAPTPPVASPPWASPQ